MFLLAFDTDEVEIGLVDSVKFKDRVNIGDSWVAVKIVIKFGELQCFFVTFYKTFPLRWTSRSLRG